MKVAYADPPYPRQASGIIAMILAALGPRKSIMLPLSRAWWMNTLMAGRSQLAATTYTKSCRCALLMCALRLG